MQPASSYVWALLNQPAPLGVHSSPFGVIPKNRPSKWCLTVNLSTPEGYSVNDQPGDRLLLSMLWEGKVYMDAALPSGLQLVPLIFSAVANALLWTVGVPNSSECWENCRLMHETCDEVGLPT